MGAVTRLALLCLLAAPLLAQSSERTLAEEFLEAFRREETDRQVLLATKPAREVAYPLVAEWLLRHGHADAARALAEAREGGPEGPGLKLLVEAYARPSAGQTQRLRAAIAFLRSGKPDEALRLLEGTRDPDPGNLHGVRLTWLRGHAFQQARRSARAAREFGLCVRLARAVGWWAQVRDAAALQLRCAVALEDKLAAADASVEAATKLDHARGLLDALRTRAALRMQRAEALEGDDAVRARRDVRRDFIAAIEIAERLGERKAQALMLRSVGVVFHRHEGQPNLALRWYEDALEILRDRDEDGELFRTLFNAAVISAQVGQYEKSLALLDELLAGEPGELESGVLAQRAYVLWRMGRPEKAARAYEVALDAAKPGTPRHRLLVQAAELHLGRGDLRRAERYVEAAPPGDPAAFVTRARIRGTKGDERGARDDFDAALAQAATPAGRLRILLLRIAQERSWGQVETAAKHASDALALLSEDFQDYGNAGAAWLVAADLDLLRGEREAARKRLSQGATLFRKLEDPYRAIPAFAQETLLLLSLDRKKEALERMKVMLYRLAPGTPSDALKSVAKATEAWFEARSGRKEKAVELLGEARELAATAGDRLREANALTWLAYLQPERGAALAREALAILDARRVDGPEEHPDIPGHRPDFAASIGVRALLETGGDAAEAFALVERARADRILLALRGREAFLAAALPEALHESYVAARSRLVEARAVSAGVGAAEKAFDAVVARLRKEAKDVASLAFPQPPALADVQAALRGDELLVLMLDDAYAERAYVAVSHDEVMLGRYGDRPLEAIADERKGKKTVIVAPDGEWSARSLASLDLDDGKAGASFRFYRVASAAAFLRGRAAPAGPGVAEEVASASVGEFPQATALSKSNVLRLLRSPAPDYGTALVSLAGGTSRFEAVAVLAEALALRGVRRVVVGRGPGLEPVWARLRKNVEKGVPADLAAAGESLTVHGVP